MKYATYRQKKALKFIWNNSHDVFNIHTIPKEITTEIAQMFNYGFDSVYKAQIDFYRAKEIIAKYLDDAKTNKWNRDIQASANYHTRFDYKL